MLENFQHGQEDNEEEMAYPGMGNSLAIRGCYILFVIETLTLGTHTVLFTDIKLGSIATHSNSSEVNFGFIYHNQTITDYGGQESVLLRASAWNLKPPSYHVFAEYTEGPLCNKALVILV